MIESVYSFVLFIIYFPLTLNSSLLCFLGLLLLNNLCRSHYRRLLVGLVRIQIQTLMDHSLLAVASLRLGAVHSSLLVCSSLFFVLLWLNSILLMLIIGFSRGHNFLVRHLCSNLLRISTQWWQRRKPTLKYWFFRLCALDHLLVLGNLSVLLVKVFLTYGTTVFEQTFCKTMVLPLDAFILFPSSDDVE